MHPGHHRTKQKATTTSTIIVQGSVLPFACVGSGDPVRVLRLLHNKYSGYSWIIYCWWLCTTCHYQSYVLTTKGLPFDCSTPGCSRADVHCSVSHGQLLSGTVLHLARTVHFGTVQSGWTTSPKKQQPHSTQMIWQIPVVQIQQEYMTLLMSFVIDNKHGRNHHPRHHCICNLYDHAMHVNVHKGICNHVWTCLS